MNRFLYEAMKSISNRFLCEAISLLNLMVGGLQN
jgi:hypothetical protein